jgi:tRNA threonylcarbamoyladenosine biosynthesis protein TsaB
VSARFTLALDASTYVGTVAVLRDGVVLAEGDAAMRGEREERLMPAVVATLAQAGCTPGEVARVVCGAGPGSFTSLRIAGAIAKGIALGAGAELCAVSSLALLVAGHATPLPAGRYLAMLDAMRGERYAVAYDVGADGAVTEGERVGLLADGAIAAACERLGASAIGPHQLLDVSPHARGVARLDGGPLVRAVALDTWEPEYGRLAEAQVKWEAAHGRPLGA